MHTGLWVFVLKCAHRYKLQACEKHIDMQRYIKKKPKEKKQAHFLHSSDNGERLLSLQALLNTALRSRSSAQLLWQVCLPSLESGIGIIVSEVGSCHCREERQGWQSAAIPQETWNISPQALHSLQCRQQTGGHCFWWFLLVDSNILS